MATEEIGKATEGNQQAKGGEDGHKDGDGQDKLDVATEEIGKATEGNQQAKGGEDGNKDGDGQGDEKGKEASGSTDGNAGKPPLTTLVQTRT